MQSSHSLDALSVQFDDDNAVADAGLLLPATLAQHLGLRDLLDAHINLGSVAGHANPGAKAMTLIASLISGGECIDDADALRAGETGQVLGHWVAAPSTLGTFLRGFSFGHARQLDKVSGQLLVRAWGSGAGPGEEPSPSMSTPRSVRPTDSRRKGARSSPTTLSLIHISEPTRRTPISYAVF